MVVIAYPSSLGNSTTFTKLMWEEAGSPNDVELGEGWTDIGSSAFQNTAITSIEIPASVTSIGGSAFKQCSSLASVTFATGSGQLSIGNSAFQETAVESIAIPASVTYIGTSAFLSCSVLASVTFAAGSTLGSIGTFAFQNTAITSIEIPASVTSIGQQAFYQCSSLAYVTFAAGSDLLAIGNGAFQAIGITSITIPLKVTYIGTSAFQSTALDSITIPASVTEIGNAAFSECFDLASVTFATGSGLLTIGEFSFKAVAITSITIPASVTSIGRFAFFNITNLDTVTFATGSQLATIGTSIFRSSGLTTFSAPLSPVLNLFGVSVEPNQTISGKEGVTVIDNTVTVEVSDPTCFPAGTPVQTDQGVTAIEQLVPGEHTLRGKSIVAITQTRPLQKHIVCFEKDSIGKNVPSQQTLCSKEHKVLYRGEMIKARDLADMCKNVKKAAYNGEALFNVLLEKHGKMLVNNMICETLHPENIAAKFAKSKNTTKKNVLLK